MNIANALECCFTSESPYWRKFLHGIQRTAQKVAWYPSSGYDFYPMLYFKKHTFETMNINIDLSCYEEPDLFIFSDYNPDNYINEPLICDPPRIRWHEHRNHSIDVNYQFEISPKENCFQYLINREYADFPPQYDTFKALCACLNITCYDIVERDGQCRVWQTYAIFFYCENVNFLSQFILRQNVSVSHLVWKRDGSGLGGGRLSHCFLLPISKILKTQWFYIWELYWDWNCYNGLPDELVEYKDKCPKTPAEVFQQLVTCGQHEWCEDKMYFCSKKISNP